MKGLLAGALALAFATTAWGWSGDCIPQGECAQIQFPLPNLGGPGFPTTASWSSGSASLYDRDRFSGDDWMGMAEITNGMAAGELCNEDGQIVGSSGQGVEGGFKGDCVEVYVLARYDFVSVIKICSSIGGSYGGSGFGGSLGSSHCQSVEIHSQGTWTSPPHQVCPC